MYQARLTAPLAAAVVLLVAALVVSRLTLGCAGMGCEQETAPGSDLVTHGETPAELVRVIDGDTIVVRLPEGSEERVRYIGMDTPEEPRSGDPGGPLSGEATAVNEVLVADGDLRLEFDRDLRDDFGRLLAYVFADGVLVNEELVRRGLAVARSYPPNTARDEELAAAEREARAAGRGIWGLPGH
jgi:micrococcal nuclease